MECTINANKKLAYVWLSRADQESEEAQKQLSDFISDCRAKHIFVCVYRSGERDVLEQTKELLVYNYNNETIDDDIGCDER